MVSGLNDHSQNAERSYADGNRFCAIWSRCGGLNGEAVFHQLQELYEGSGRHYHNLGHIGYSLKVFDSVSTLSTDADSMELAIWFHDSIYDMRATDNERQSAELFMQCSLSGVPEHRRTQVYGLIMATDPRHEPNGPEHGLLVDIDLSGFGRSWEQFRSDGGNVRREMDHQSDEQFYAGQARFMAGLLARQPLYTSDRFQQRYEQTARANLHRYLAQLAEQGYSADD